LSVFTYVSVHFYFVKFNFSKPGMSNFKGDGGAT